MGQQGTQPSTFPQQGKPGTGPGQLGQEPQQQSEHGLQPIPQPENENGEHCEPVEQANQNKRPEDREERGNGF